MADTDTKDVQATTVAGATQEQINISMDDQKAAEAAAAAESTEQTPTAESLGVTAEQFDKFYNADNGYNWEAHAKESEYKLSQKAGEADPDAAAADDKTAQKAASDAGLDFSDLEAKIIKDGDIGEADYAALEAIGIPKDIAGDYIEGIKFRASAQVKAVTEAFGGAEGLAKVEQFVQANYTADEIATLERDLSDPEIYKVTVDAIHARMEKEAAGTIVHGTNQQGGGDGGTGVEPYATQMDMVADQRDPRYKTSEAFRKTVMARAAVSTWDAPRGHNGGL